MSASPRQRRADITVDTWNGVTDRLERLFDRRSQVCGRAHDVQVLAVTNVANAERYLQSKTRVLELPYIAVAPQAVEPNQQSYNAHMMRRNGVRSRLSADGSTWTILKLTPVVLTFQVLLVTDDVFTMLRMVDRWNANELWGFVLKNDQSDDDYQVKIQVVADKALQMPPITPDAGGSDQYQLSTTLRASTYAGYVWQVPSIKAVEFDINVTTDDLTRLEDDPDGIEAYQLRSTYVAPGHAEEQL